MHQVEGEPRPDDYEDLWECAVCGLNGDVSRIPKQEQITNTIELIDNPNDQGTAIESVFRKRNFNKNNTRSGKPVKRGRKNKKNVLHHDPDIEALMRIYGEQNVRVVYDSNP